MPDKPDAKKSDSLNDLLTYELHSSQRYRRYASILLVSCDSPGEIPESHPVTRRSDVCFQLPAGRAWVLPETPKAGAVVAAQRLRADSGDPPGSWRVGVASFPDDGFSAEELMEAVERRLRRSKSMPDGDIVADD